LVFFPFEIIINKDPFVLKKINDIVLMINLIMWDNYKRFIGDSIELFFMFGDLIDNLIIFKGSICPIPLFLKQLRGEEWGVWKYDSVVFLKYFLFWNILK
jgi:hypothetical protein